MGILQSQTQKEISTGQAYPLGASLKEEGVNFSIFSQYAQQVYLMLFDGPDSPATDIIQLHRTENIWHTFVKGIHAGQLYGYKVEGEYNPAQGKRFNPYKLLIDPYAKALTGKFKDQEYLLFSYDTNSPEKDMVMDQRDNSHIVPKCIVIDDGFDWEGDKRPGISMDELVIYEVHLKGFTSHPSSGVSHPGTYLGFIEKIPYLKQLGINAVELMPIHEFFVRRELTDKGLNDYWGYNSIAFFSPEITYSTQTAPGCQVQEFKKLVKALHQAGIEVILDVVYNHTGEGNHLGPTLCFKGIDNPTYYKLCKNSEKPEAPYYFYLNDSGCGNTFDAEHPAAMALILDSLRYWVDVMHVDGFRFDLASILARASGTFSQSSLFFESISKDPVLSKIKMIAEPWDLTTYQVGNFPIGWSEWNGKFRDTTRRYLRGDEGQAPDMAKRLTGSADLYQDDGRKPYNSINLITCHDGFTLWDLFSYNEKHNEANHEENKDGTSENYSWNCGIEGDSKEPAIVLLRKQMIKNAFCCLLFSAGTPTILYGDEVMRTQKGNNNSYCQDNELSWFNWNDVKEHEEVLQFCSKAISLRKSSPMLKCRRFFVGETGTNEPDILWFGKHLEPPHWDNPKMKTLCYELCNSNTSDKCYLFLALNMNDRACFVDLPQHEGMQWYQLVNTSSQKPGHDIFSYQEKRLLSIQDRHYCASRSVNILWGGLCES